MNQASPARDRKAPRDRTGEDPFERELRRERRRIARVARRGRLEEWEARSGDRRARHRRRGPVLDVAVALVRHLPLAVAAVLGEVVGSLAWWASPSLRGKVLGNLTTAYGEAPGLARTGRRSVALAGRSLFSLLVLHRLGRERTLERFTSEGHEAVDRAIAEGPGVIFVTAHIGLFEAFGAWTANRWGTLTIGRDAREGNPTQRLISMREDMGLTTIQRGETRELLRAFREGRPVAMLVDHDLPDARGVFVPFFGRLAHTVPAPATLAIRWGLPLVFCHVEWDGLTRHRARFFELLHPRDDLPRQEAILELTARMTRQVEDAVRRRPDHWLWLHRRWRTQPEDRPELAVYRGDPA